MSWILGDDWKNTVKRTESRDGIFAKSSRCGTSRQRAQVWNRWSLGHQSHISESRDHSYVSSAICPECPVKQWRRKSFWLQSTPTGKRLKGCPRTSGRDYIFDLAWSLLGVELAELFEITVDREVFWVLLVLLPPATFPKDKADTKMSEWMSMQAYNETLYLWNCL